MPSKVEHEELEGRPEWSAAGHILKTRDNAAHMSGVFEQLTLEHAALLSMLLDLQTTTDPLVRLGMLERVTAELAAHEEAETAVISRRMLEHPKLAAFAHAHAEEAEKLLQVTQQLCSIPPRDEAWNSTLQQLVAILQQHTRREETRAFPAASKVWGAKTDALEREYANARADALQK
jgi:hypothetical protein